MNVARPHDRRTSSPVAVRRTHVETRRDRARAWGTPAIDGYRRRAVSAIPPIEATISTPAPPAPMAAEIQSNPPASPVSMSVGGAGGFDWISAAIGAGGAGP